jgi:tetratricopeptide (TPR) repeat protein
LDQSDIFVQEVRKQRDRLTQTQTALQEAIKTEQRQEPERDNVLALLRKADGERQDADFDGALKTYDEILKRFGDRLDVRKTRDDLERAWQVKNDQHRQARVFVYETWPNMRTVEDVERNLPKAREALAVCKQVGDRLTPLKLMSTFPTTAEIVGKAVDEIAKSETDTDKLNLPRLQKLSEELGAFIKEVHAYVRPEEAKSP